MTKFDKYRIIILEVIVMRKSEFYSDYKKARDTAWKVIFKYGISHLPVDVKKLCKDMNLLYYNYEDGKELIERYKLQPLTINDGFSNIIKNRYAIFYNETIQPHTRKRFTVAHEIGHIVLGHLACDSTACRSGVSLWNRTGDEPNPTEAAANVFASRLLAPACVLHALDIHTDGDIASLCGLSNTAAEIRAKRMNELYAREREWMRTKGRSCFGVSPQERRALAQFGQFIAEYKEK